MNKNDINFTSMSNGGTNSHYNVDRKTVKINGMKATGHVEEPEVRSTAKASPKFVEVEPEVDQTEDQKKKSIAKNTKKVKE